MQNSLYWIISLIFAIILLIILLSEYRTNNTGRAVDRSFRLMLTWVIYFCLQDTVWGLCDAGIIPGEKYFYASSTVFHLSTVVTTFFWLNFILVFLGEKLKKRILYLTLDGIIILMQVCLVIYNFFQPVIFSIEDGSYATKPLRMLAFVDQYIVYLAICLITLFFTFKEKKGERETYFAVFIFTLAPILTGIFQLLFPGGPFYSIGYFLGCFEVYMFVVDKTRLNYSRSMFLRPLADIYYTMHIFDLEKGVVEPVFESELIRRLSVGISSPQEIVNRGMRGTISPEHQDAALEFVDLSTLSERLNGKKSISCDFMGRVFGWTRVQFVSMETDGDKQRKVMMTTQVVDEEKKYEIDLLFKSNHDELTGLHNRRSYDAEVSRILAGGMDDQFVYVSMDLNGLKKTNDTKGHAAGDELLCGAAECMKNCFGVYGDVYRIGGDEFVALITANDAQLIQIKEDFANALLNWKGESVDSIAVSVGCVKRSEMPNASIKEMALLADERMYSDKAAYYRNK